MIRARFLYLCSGYYSYEAPHRPEFAGEADFQGQLIHPQFWRADLDHSGRRVRVVIGSGATAVTLVPELARTAAAVTMLQRSPSYVLALPEIDPVAKVIRRVLPAGSGPPRDPGRERAAAAGHLRAVPPEAQDRPQGLPPVVLSYLKDPAFVDQHGPAYGPRDQRLCLAPDGDIFQAVRDGRATVVTEAIDRFVPEGIGLRSGTVLAADIVVTATRLNLRALGGVALRGRLDPGGSGLDHRVPGVDALPRN